MARTGLLAVLCLALGAAGAALAQGDAQGAQVYRSRCALCHGRAGDGRGAGAAGLTPRPADFTRPELWARATPDALATTVRQGRPGTPMPPFADLSDDDLQAVVAYLATFRPPAP